MDIKIIIIITLGLCCCVFYGNAEKKKMKFRIVDGRTTADVPTPVAEYSVESGGNGGGKQSSVEAPDHQTSEGMSVRGYVFSTALLGVGVWLLLHLPDVYRRILVIIMPGR